MYKRQPQAVPLGGGYGLPQLRRAFDPQPVRLGLGREACCRVRVTVGVGAVSYTHLDVYKRQVIDGVEMEKLTPAQLRQRRREITMIFQQFNLLMQRSCCLLYTSLDPWTSSATLDVSLLSGLLRSERGSDNPGAQELEAGRCV